MANETENTILAFTEWLDANDKSYLLIVSGGKDENICIAHDTKGNLVEAINDEDELEDWIDDIFHHPYHDMYLYQS